MYHNHVAAKFVLAGLVAGAVAVEQAVEAAGIEVDAGNLITIVLAGAMGLIATLIGTAWKDLRERLRDAQRERDDLKRQLRMMDEFRARAMWVCPLMDANASAEERRAHLQSHLDRLPPKRKP